MTPSARRLPREGVPTVMPRFKRASSTPRAFGRARASLEYWVARSSRAMTCGEGLELPGLGELNFYPQFDLRQHRVEAGVAGGGFEIGRGVAQPADGGGVEIAGQQAELEIVQHVERALAALYRTLAPFGRILLDALQGEQCVDIGRGFGSERCAGVLRRSHIVRKRKAGRAGSPGVAGGRSDRGAVRSVDAHGRDLAGRVARKLRLAMVNAG